MGGPVPDLYVALSGVLREQAGTPDREQRCLWQFFGVGVVAQRTKMLVHHFVFVTGKKKRTIVDAVK
jgi:hypothetical protein